MDKTKLWALIDERGGEFEKMSDEIWGYAELCFQEHKSTKLQREFMEREGFRITTPVARMDTAFIAECGSGSPILAILGENDALPGQSQCADVTGMQPEVPGADGHACGHHLLGCGSMEAACALKRLMEENKLPGTLRYYACPAEEGGGGKVFMTQAGVFDDVDACVTWHPGARNAIGNSALACCTAYFRFEGKASHASAAPWDGVSALDAVTLMNVGVQFLREHSTPDTRIHYAITNTGGDAPNVVQHTAEVIYVVRAAKNEYMADRFRKVCDIARGAALMTGATLTGPDIRSSYTDFIKNDTMEDLIIANLEAQLPLPYTEEEIAYAKKFQPFGNQPNAESPLMLDMDTNKNKPGLGSTDVADVSYATAVGQASVVTHAIGTIGHGWMMTAQGKSAIAYRGMHAAAKCMAGAIYDLLNDPAKVEAAKADHKKALAGAEYFTLIPADKVPGR